MILSTLWCFLQVHLKVDNVYKVQNKNIWLNSAEFRAAETKVQYCVSIVFKLVESHVLMCCHSRGDIVGCHRRWLLVKCGMETVKRCCGTLRKIRNVEICRMSTA